MLGILEGLDAALWLRTLVGVIVLIAATMALLALAGVRLGSQPVIAVLRAMVQLGLAAMILSGVLTAPWTALLVLVFMALMASVTSGSRLGQITGGRASAAIAIACGTLLSVPAVFGMGMMPLETRNVIAIGGIVIGNAMTAATLAGRSFGTLAVHRSGEVEAWWALGAASPIAFADVARHAVRESLIPNLDQTRTAGAVTLPGTFIGALAGGASPLEAGRFQIVVLTSILFAQTVTALVLTRRLARVRRLPITVSA